MKPIRWELGSYMYANSKVLPGVFFMIWGVALALIWAREVIVSGAGLLRRRKPYLALPPPSDDVAPFPIQAAAAEADPYAADGSAPAS